MNESITELQNIWSKVKLELSKTIEDARFFDVFLVDSSIHSIEDGVMTISVISNLSVTLLTSKYIEVVQSAVKSVMNQNLVVKFESKENLKSVAKPENEKPVFFKNCIVNPSLTFDNFISGSCNLEAKQAALFIAQDPGKGFNPLFIYANPGLGKTHLMHAIVNYIHENMPGKKALYCDGNDFVQEYVNFATGINRENNFKEYVTSFDCFLIDDIQNLANKERTCIEFFDIFNALVSKGKQIVITSDKHPSELKSFDERLKSRFGSGLTIAIGQPDVQTCLAILKNKINKSLLDINAFEPRVLEFIAEKFSKNIRDIDSAYNKLVWYVTAFRPTKYVTMEVAMDALQSLIEVKESTSTLNEQRIISMVADYYNKTPSQLIGPSRVGEITFARHIAMYLIKNLLDTPTTKIGALFGGRDHSTVKSAVEKVERELKINPNIEQAINDIKGRLKP